MKQIRLIILATLWCGGALTALAQTPTPSPTPTPTATATPSLPLPNQRTLLPVGTLIMWTGNYTPTGWLVADGSCVSQTTYPSLYQVVGGAFGNCQSTDFRLPDLRGRVPVGSGTGAYPGPGEGNLTPRNAGETFGYETHTLEINELPAHAHDMKFQNVSLSVATGATAISWSILQTTRPIQTGIIQNTGGTQAHNIMQPSTVLHFLVWTGNETLDIGDAALNPTNTPDPIRVESTIEVAGTPQALAFEYRMTGGDVGVVLLLFLIAGLQVLQMVIQVVQGKR